MQEKEILNNIESVETPITQSVNKPQQIIFTKEVRKAFGIKLPPYRREYPKIGRNDTCPCGSGIKYKKCCMEINEIKT